MRLQDKRTLVTGGSDGIGLAIAEAFLRDSADVLIVGRDAGKLEAARQKLTAPGLIGQVETVSGDLATSPGIAAVISRLL
ncbi:SDR family NAD(P)-dependent oxidoreductase [Mesorhizobium sp. NZP2077]|uniref:SDR family NAD(P)-dependent oxidoreductase n=1 Tax=Mesorhizobium sp. NZP2077 TaxID=2483404 RepID=UPI002484CEFF|nr:SDR family NAD(P)-dependent oxidoreductase [Mesorhizobium sp. NZP2077]